MPELCNKKLLYFGTNMSDILKLDMKARNTELW